MELTSSLRGVEGEERRTEMRANTCGGGSLVSLIQHGRRGKGDVRGNSRSQARQSWGLRGQPGEERGGSIAVVGQVRWGGLTRTARSVSCCSAGVAMAEIVVLVWLSSCGARENS